MPWTLPPPPSLPPSPSLSSFPPLILFPGGISRCHLGAGERTRTLARPVSSHARFKKGALMRPLAKISHSRRPLLQLLSHPALPAAALARSLHPAPHCVVMLLQPIDTCDAAAPSASAVNAIFVVKVKTEAAAVGGRRITFHLGGRSESRCRAHSTAAHSTLRVSPPPPPPGFLIVCCESGSGGEASRGRAASGGAGGREGRPAAMPIMRPMHVPLFGLIESGQKIGLGLLGGFPVQFYLFLPKIC